MDFERRETLASQPRSDDKIPVGLRYLCCSLDWHLILSGLIALELLALIALSWPGSKRAADREDEPRRQPAGHPVPPAAARASPAIDAEQIRELSAEISALEDDERITDELEQLKKEVKGEAGPTDASQ